MESSPVASVGILPTYETSWRKCARCPTRYLECKRIGEEGYRLCCACWWLLAEETIVYGVDQFARQGVVQESALEVDSEKNYSSEGIEDPAAAERAYYQRQVAENKTHKML